MNMFTRHVAEQLSAYHHRELRPDEIANIEHHLGECSKCRAIYEEIRFGARLASRLPLVKAPESMWRDLQHTSITQPRRNGFALLAFAGTLAAAVVTISLFLVHNIPIGPSWAVSNVRGTPQIGSRRIVETGRLGQGEALQTDAFSEAEVQIANIGRLEIDPNTKIRLVVTKSDQHRISLERGKVEARTWAPPRLFIVDTPSASAVDFGCQYTLEIEKDGGSLLHVTLGLVSLEDHGRVAYVPAGAMARTRSGFGPGTPFHEESSVRFQSALNAIDFGANQGERKDQIEIILSEAKDRDAVTLWHLLPRIDVQGRQRVADRLAAFVPPPAGVTSAGVVALDASMLRAWGESIPELWWMKGTAQ
jgi:hypothetical protein